MTKADLLKQFICAVTHAQAKLLPESLDLDLSGSRNGCEPPDLSIVQQPRRFLRFFVVIADKKTSALNLHPGGFHGVPPSSRVLPWMRSWCHHLLSADSGGDKWAALRGGRGGGRISRGWGETPSSLRLLCVSLLLGHMGSPRVSTANTISLSQSRSIMGVVLGRTFPFENVLR